MAERTAGRRAQDATVKTPTNSMYRHYCDALEDRHLYKRILHTKEQEEKQPNSREMVRYFLSALAPPQVAKPPKLPQDLARLTRVLNSIYHAVHEEVLTEREADAVIAYIAECFTRRRFDEVVSKITKPRTGAWFVLQSHVTGD